jgi:regulator of RNase E activity RraA
MLSLTHVNWDDFEGDILLMKNEGDTQSVGGGILSTIELENHVSAAVRDTGHLYIHA